MATTIKLLDPYHIIPSIAIDISLRNVLVIRPLWQIGWMNVTHRIFALFHKVSKRIYEKSLRS